MLREHTTKMELYREVTNQHSELSQNLEEYFKRSNLLFGSEQNIDTNQPFKVYNPDPLSGEELERQIHKIECLKEATS